MNNTLDNSGVAKMEKPVVLIFMLCLLTSIATAETLTFEIQNYEIKKVDGYEIINASNLLISSSLSGMALPKGIVLKKYSQNQPVDEIRLVKFYEPEELNINLPDIGEDEKFIDRTCYSSTREPELFVNDPIITEDMAQYSIQITPVEVVDCEAGKFILYKKTDYEIVRHASPVRIQRVAYTKSTAPGTKTKISVELNLAATGELKLVDDLGDEIDSIIINSEKHADFIIDSPSEEDKTEYTVEFWEEGKRISFMNAEVATEWGNVDFKCYVSDNKNIIPVKVNITNNLDKEIEVELSYQLFDWDMNLDKEINTTKKIAPGITVFPVDL